MPEFELLPVDVDATDVGIDEHGPKQHRNGELFGYHERYTDARRMTPVSRSGLLFAPASQGSGASRITCPESGGVCVSVTPVPVREFVRRGLFSGDPGLTGVGGSAESCRSSLPPSRSWHSRETSGVPAMPSSNIGPTEASMFGLSCIGIARVPVLASDSGGCIIGQ